MNTKNPEFEVNKEYNEKIYFDNKVNIIENGNLIVTLDLQNWVDADSDSEYDQVKSILKRPLLFTDFGNLEGGYVLQTNLEMSKTKIFTVYGGPNTIDYLNEGCVR